MAWESCFSSCSFMYIRLCTLSAHVHRLALQTIVDKQSTVAKKCAGLFFTRTTVHTVAALNQELPGSLLLRQPEARKNGNRDAPCELNDVLVHARGDAAGWCRYRCGYDQVLCRGRRSLEDPGPVPPAFGPVTWPSLAFGGMSAEMC